MLPSCSNTIQKTAREKESGRKLFCSPDCVRRHAKQPKRYDIDWIIANFSKLSYRQIADHFNVTLRAITARICQWRKDGIDFGPPYVKPPKPLKPPKEKKVKEKKPPKVRERPPKPVKVPKERATKHIKTKDEPKQLPTRVIDGSRMKYVQVDSRTRIQVHIDIPDDVAVVNWNKKREKALINR